MQRRHFLALTGGGLSASAGLSAARPARGASLVAVLADTHVIDEYYQGPEGSPEDTETIHRANSNFVAARDAINSLAVRPDVTLIAGDLFHNYPSDDPAFCLSHRTRIDEFAAIRAGFRMPVHCCFGNHDYAFGRISREASHELFRSKLALAPYYSALHRGIKFIQLNNFLGASHAPDSTPRSREQGSFGETQLNWLDAELADHKPAILTLHFPLLAVRDREVSDLGLPSLIRKHRDSIQLVVAGHWHKWVEFGRTFGVPHLAVGSTRYDRNACLFVEVDPARPHPRILNDDRLEWNTHYCRPWTGR